MKRIGTRQERIQFARKITYIKKHVNKNISYGYGFINISFLPNCSCNIIYAWRNEATKTCTISTCKPLHSTINKPFFMCAFFHSMPEKVCITWCVIYHKTWWAVSAKQEQATNGNTVCFPRSFIWDACFNSINLVLGANTNQRTMEICL